MPLLKRKPEWAPPGYDKCSPWQKFLYLYVYWPNGTEFHWYKDHFFCIDCGSKIPLKNFVLRKRWKHTVCPSCEEFCEIMANSEYIESLHDWSNAQWD